MLAMCSLAVQARATGFQNFGLWQSGDYRGFNIGSTSTDNMEDFRSINANIGRTFVRLTRPNGGNQFALPTDVYEVMDRKIQAARTYGFKLVVTFNPAPTFWTNAEQRASLVAVMRQFARHYAGESAFAGFDLINEPYPARANVPPSFDVLVAWESVASQMITAIRQEDPTRVVIYEFPYHSLQFGAMRPLPFGGIVYSTHMYTPHDLTHQGIGDRPFGVSYPSSATSKIGAWNKTVMQEKLAPLRAFQLKHRVPIYIGEFNCIRSAPGQSSDNYVKDAASIFEAYGWSWTLYVFRGGLPWWDAESAHGVAGAPRSLNTNVMIYLRELLAKNP